MSNSIGILQSPTQDVIITVEPTLLGFMEQERKYLLGIKRNIDSNLARLDREIEAEKARCQAHSP